MITLPENWIDPAMIFDENERELVGIDGNAGAIMAHVNRILKGSGNSREVQDAYRIEAMSGDYDNLIIASLAYCGMVS